MALSLEPDATLSPNPTSGKPASREGPLSSDPAEQQPPARESLLPDGFASGSKWRRRCCSTATPASCYGTYPARFQRRRLGRSQGRAELPPPTWCQEARVPSSMIIRR